jgi:hypothetical protein
VIEIYIRKKIEMEATGQIKYIFIQDSRVGQSNRHKYVIWVDIKRPTKK